VPRLLPAAPGPLVKPAVEFLPYVHSWTKRTALLKIQVELPAVSTIPILGAMCSRHEGIPSTSAAAGATVACDGDVS
jgi:hypothetical protein